MIFSIKKIMAYHLIIYQGQLLYILKQPGFESGAGGQ